MQQGRQLHEEVSHCSGHIPAFCGRPFAAAEGAQSADEMATEFFRPPDSAKPWAYWVWLNGNVTKEGITKDLEEMKREGINGVLIFQAGDRGTPPGVAVPGRAMARNVSAHLARVPHASACL